MILAIIPARKGSKGIPRKNLALLDGKPLVEYTIQAALESNFIDEVLLSTDDNEIASIGCKLGLENKYVRPGEVSTDTAGMIDTILHAISWFEKDRGFIPDQILLLQPTSPLRNREDIDSAISMYRHLKVKSLVSVHRMREHPYECLIKKSEREWNYLAQSELKVSRRQDYQHNYFFINGAIYLFDTKMLIENRTLIFPGESALYEMPYLRGVDVDTALDLKIAELILRSKELTEDF